MQAQEAAPLPAAPADKEQLYKRIIDMKSTLRVDDSFMEQTKAFIMGLRTVVGVTRVSDLIEKLEDHVRSIRETPASSADELSTTDETRQAVVEFRQALWTEVHGRRTFVLATQAEKEQLHQRIVKLRPTLKLSVNFLAHTKSVIINLKGAAAVKRVCTLIENLEKHTQSIKGHMQHTPSGFAEAPYSLNETHVFVHGFWKDLWREGQRDDAAHRSGQ
ncbi:unnamed protein product [Vitrella brassicaformis CCMP3155]|uniref:Uncharacterized protein n=2 Tax=Vitrella brassicaformis TaxID=1169539 RepID=A0A0G4ESA5_VITBC|nr:unnamed protein product [Vitrella brassicaformis CCMP3155]|eukprot:CEM00792.1 unnamed protein product [Vitrella brassicaformis CCMP3155]